MTGNGQTQVLNENKSRPCLDILLSLIIIYQANLNCQRQTVKQINSLIFLTLLVWTGNDGRQKKPIKHIISQMPIIQVSFVFWSLTVSEISEKIKPLKHIHESFLNQL